MWLASSVRVTDTVGRSFRCGGVAPVHGSVKEGQGATPRSGGVGSAGVGQGVQFGTWSGGQLAAGGRAVGERGFAVIESSIRVTIVFSDVAGWTVGAAGGAVWPADAREE